MKKISPEIKLRIVSLSGKVFWYWKSFYNFYSSILNISSHELENKMPRNIFNKYKATEKILEDLELQNKIDLQKQILSEFYNLSAPFDKKDNPNYSVAEIELSELKKIIGKDVIKEELEKKEVEKRVKIAKQKNSLEKEKSKEIQKIKKTFCEYSSRNDKKQERGYWLEKAFFDILELEQVESIRPYKTKTEQIDGHFKYDKFDYLVEIKWQEAEIKQKDIDIFDGKLKSKAQSTRGLFLATSVFSDSAVACAQNKNSPRIIFIDVQDFISVLEERRTFLDVLQTKIDRLVRLGKVYK